MRKKNKKQRKKQWKNIFNKKKVKTNPSLIILENFFTICCSDIKKSLTKVFAGLCDSGMAKIYLKAAPTAFIVVLLLELKLFPLVVFSLMKYKFEIVVTD